MLRPRIIPCLLVSSGGLVKTLRFKDPTYVGDPINAVRIFNEKESDELIVLDIDATVKRTTPDMKMIARLAAECRMPLCYGGGVRTVQQATEIVALGVEKVAISSAALDDPTLPSEIAREVGSQSVVLVLDVRKRVLGGYQIYTHNGTRAAGSDPFVVAAEAEANGAGEIVVNSIDNDGAMKGYDLDLARRMRAATHLPLTVLGGAGSLDDMAKLIDACGIVGAAAGSLFVFKGPHRAVLISYPDGGQKEALYLQSTS